MDNPMKLALSKQTVSQTSYNKS